MSKKKKPKQLTLFQDEIRDPGCALCSLHQGAEFVCLMGVARKPATGPKVMIVGEAPGQREDEKYEAFVGRSGELLDRALKDLAGLDRDECYVTNVVKCRPPDNRTPERREVKVCSDRYLEQEYDKVQPDFVLVLGNSALQGVLQKSGITRQQGTVFKRELAEGKMSTIMPTIHPAAVLRNPKWGPAFGMDIQRFGKIVRGEDTGLQTNSRIVRTKSQLVWLREKLMAADVISWDIETYTFPAKPPFVRSNFQEWWGIESQIASIAFSTEVGESVTVPLYHRQSPWVPQEWHSGIIDSTTVRSTLADRCQAILDYLKPALTRKDCRYIAHNGKFDARWMAAKGIVIPQTDDTMLSAHMLDENRPKGLKPLSKTELGADSYDVGEELGDAVGMPLRRLCIYNGKDTDYTLRLDHKFQRQLAEEPRIRKVYRKLMMPASEALVDIERTGVYIDPERWRTRHDEAVEKRAILYDYINKFVPEEMRPINLNSPVQVGRFLFEHLELPIIEKTAKGQPSSKESVLLRLADQHKAATALIKYRKWAKYLSTYILPLWYEHRDLYGRVHSNYKLFGTVTGRLSAQGGIQQVPRDPFIRSIIGATPGWTFVQADYSQVELRVAFWLANERAGLRQYAAGEDIHMIRAMKMTGKPAHLVSKEERKKAKAVNFGYIYGMGAPKFVTYAFDNYGVKVSLAEAEKDRNGFFRDYPALKPWHEKQRTLARKYGRVNSPIGRVRHLTDITSGDKDVRAESERQAINSPVQSFASDLMLTSLVELHKSIDPKQARIVGTVHDSILFEVKDKHVDRYCAEIKGTMEDMSIVQRKFGTEVTVPIVADIEVGTHWGETEEWKAA